MIDYAKILNPVARDMKPSGIRKFFEIAATRKDCISLGVGEPDFITPRAFSQAAIDSILEGKTQYTANAGLMELRKAISKYLDGFIGVHYDPASEIIITVGASEALDAAFRAVCAPGDEVLIPEPCFVCYAPLVSLTGATPVSVKCFIEDEFKLNVDEIKKAITPRTKAILVAFPNNPTGAVMEKSDLEKLAPVILENDLVVFSDEIYGELVYNGVKFCSVASLEGMRERTIVISGFSKAFAMTGWRLGYICAPKPIIDVVYKIHQYGIMCAPTRGRRDEREVRRAPQISRGQTQRHGAHLLRAQRRLLRLPLCQVHGYGRRGICLRAPRSQERRSRPRQRVRRQRQGLHPHLLRLLRRRHQTRPRPHRGIPQRAQEVIVLHR